MGTMKDATTVQISCFGVLIGPVWSALSPCSSLMDFLWGLGAKTLEV